MTTFTVNGHSFEADPADEDALYQASEDALDVLMQIVDSYEDLPRAEQPPMDVIIAVHDKFGSGDWHIALQEGREVSVTLSDTTYTVTVS